MDRPQYPFFLPVKILSRVFRGKFLAGLKHLYRGKNYTALARVEQPAKGLLIQPALFVLTSIGVFSIT
jgi:hypothetical protein